MLMSSDIIQLQHQSPYPYTSTSNHFVSGSDDSTGQCTNNSVIPQLLIRKKKLFTAILYFSQYLSFESFSSSTCLSFPVAWMSLFSRIDNFHFVCWDIKCNYYHRCFLSDVFIHTAFKIRIHTWLANNCLAKRNLVGPTYNLMRSQIDTPGRGKLNMMWLSKKSTQDCYKHAACLVTISPFRKIKMLGQQRWNR